MDSTRRRTRHGWQWGVTAVAAATAVTLPLTAAASINAESAPPDVGVIVPYIFADDEGRVTRAFTPDFFLPQYDLYIEITTLNQKLVTKKNRKIRKLRELYPGINCKIFYQRDYLSLVTKYGLEDVTG